MANESAIESMLMDLDELWFELRAGFYQCQAG